MPKGSCLCGKLQYSFTDTPRNKVLCHCLQCRKITGSAFSTNVVVPRATFSIDGPAKHYTFEQEMGDIFTTTFCGECGTTVAKQTELEWMKEVVVVEGGTLDDEFEASTKPVAEYFTKHRAGWLQGLPGAVQEEVLPK